MQKIAFHTLGCKVNQVETEQIMEEFVINGYTVVDFNEAADIYIINTCTVTHVSDRKSRAMLRRAARRNPDAIVVATGCMAQLEAEKLAGIEGIDLVIGNSHKENILSIIKDYCDNRQEEPRIVCGEIKVEDRLKPVLYSRQHQRTRAFVKIQDGCRSFCSYCIVPYARGTLRSKLPEDVFREIEQLLFLNYREIVLTGIHTGLYGNDLSQAINLEKLIKLILKKFTADYRIRLSSIETTEVSEGIINLLANEDRLCRHLHVPLQSGSNKVLKAMNRRYDREYYAELIHRVAGKVPGIALTTDIMVGFPMEEDNDFLQTYELIKDLPIFDLHVFKYSPRPGTRAAQISSRVNEKEKQQRSQKLIELAKEKRRIFIEGLLGQDLESLVERKQGSNKYLALSDNYIEMEFVSEQDREGKFIHLIPESINDDIVQGRLSYG